MHYYPSKNNDRLNRRTFSPDVLTGRAMCNPHYPVMLAPGTGAIEDSGAFQERDMLARLFPWSALDRQLRHEQQIAWGMGNPDWHFEGIVTYDMLVGVDEAIVNGRRVKRRGSEETARLAVEETIKSAAYYATQRHRIQGAIAYAAQGATARQYLQCVEELLILARPGRDWIALGGWCILGRMRSLLPSFYETMELIMPRLVAKSIYRAHLLGVCLPEAVRFMAEIERKYKIVISTDSSAPEMCGIMGKMYQDGVQKQVFTKDQKLAPDGYHPANLAIENIKEYSRWISSL